ncbi:TetR/AcrR family transcriptional regulator [Nocardia sp. NPDC051030]|uniref:TetR/AcrR family transcriptional regulator n=1 Tax=Nocardia sp. NPDC051030 TaxID=3155162 RepID=UPI003423D7C1
MSAVDRLLSREPGTPPRADARRNLERLVTATRSAVADTGVTVTAQEIAQRAGVGKGTFYRRVPSLEILLQVVLEEVLEEAVAAADNALDNPDPWLGFTDFATIYVRLRAESCGVNEALGDIGAYDLDEFITALQDRLRRLVERAQTVGAMRADISWQDTAFVLAGAATDPRTIGVQATPDQWNRNLRLILDGLATHR